MNLQVPDESKDRGLVECQIGARRAHVITVITGSSDDNQIAWYFRSDKHDINFSVTWHPGFPSNKAELLERMDITSKAIGFAFDTTVVVPLQRCASHEKAIKGSHKNTTGAGVYRFVWDNAYSTFTSKTLRYFIDSNVDGVALQRDSTTSSDITIPAHSALSDDVGQSPTSPEASNTASS